LVSPSPGRGGQDLLDAGRDRVDGGVEQTAGLVAGELDQAASIVLEVASDGGEDGQECVGEHRQGGPPVPEVPATDLVLVQADQTLGGLEVLLDFPPQPGHRHELGQGNLAWGPASVPGQLTSRVVTLDQ
jgi:hypothetical protein